MIVSIDVSKYEGMSESTMLRELFSYDDKLYYYFMSIVSSYDVSKEFTFNYVFEDDSEDLKYIQSNYPDLLI